jgi:hypothetical protein
MAMNHQTDISNGHMHTYMWKNLIDYFVNFVFQISMHSFAFEKCLCDIYLFWKSQKIAI